MRLIISNIAYSYSEEYKLNLFTKYENVDLSRKSSSLEANKLYQLYISAEEGCMMDLDTVLGRTIYNNHYEIKN